MPDVRMPPSAFSLFPPKLRRLSVCGVVAALLEVISMGTLTYEPATKTEDRA
jgi:hypothetical protein